jgi:hypothetical protein
MYDNLYAGRSEDTMWKKPTAHTLDGGLLSSDIFLAARSSCGLGYMR